MILDLIALLLQAIILLMYKPHIKRGLEKADWLRASVVICAFNEGGMGGRTGKSGFSSCYPQEKLEGICVNDSTAVDLRKTADTWSKQSGIGPS
jgi:hypothetical protein